MAEVLTAPSYPRFGENVSALDAESTNSAVRFKFTGDAAEYFRIWIVNLCLSVVTLGIYSAWAKVRRKRYFYGNTLLNGAAFEYLADPKAILKGRIIVLAVVALVGVFGDVTGAKIGGLIYLVVLPYIVIKASRFNAVNSALRNVRFQFGSNFPSPRGWCRSFVPGYRETSQFLILPVVLVPLSFGLLYPYYAFRKRQFLLEHTAFGTTPFTFDARPGQYYFAYFKAALLFIAFLVGSVITVGIAALPLYILFAAYRDAAVGRIAWRHSASGTLHFDCSWKTWDLFKLHLLNSLAVIVTLGLAVPWAAIRAARYELQGLSLRPAGALEGFLAASAEQVAATGDEASELLGFDFGL
jgi:uncharacterized membrane protein YjgN (DUF898 family)